MKYTPIFRMLPLAALLGLTGCHMTDATHSSMTEVTNQQQESTFSLAQLYSDNLFQAARVPATRWLEDGSGYTLLEHSSWTNDNDQEITGQDIVRYHPQTQAKDVLVAAHDLIPDGQEQPLSIADYQWSDDGTKVLIFTNTVRSWRTHTLGDYWVLNLTSKKLTQVYADASESTLQFAKFNPQGDQVAFVQGNNLYVQSLASLKLTQLTTDGDKYVINGTFDWVNEEEFGLQDGFRWSPDGKSIAYWQVDTTGVPFFTMIDNVSELYPQLTEFPYPKVGEKNSTLRIGVVSSTGGQTQWMNTGGNPEDTYLVRMEWAGNSDTLMIQKMNRAQNHLELLYADSHTGQTQVLVEEQSNAWVEQVDDMRFFRDGKSFTWQSERNGYRHLYRYDQDSNMPLLALTTGNYDVVQLLEIVANDQGEGYAYFIASPDAPLERYLYRVNLNGQEEPERLTPADWEGTHGYQVSKDGLFAVHHFSKVGVPGQTRMIALPEHKTITEIELNNTLQQKVDRLVTSTTEFFQVPVRDGLVLDGYVMKPEDFNAKKKYPVIMHVYGEPWGQTVANQWLGHLWLWHEYMTQQGYVVVSIDNRGTRSPRGQAWRHSIYKQLGIVTVRDQADALDAMLAQWSWMDGSRIGIWGHSGGGTQTLNALFRYPDKFHVGIATAPVPDLRLYDTIYQERYSGLLPQDADSYEETSAVTHAQHLVGKLLIIHGTGDDNVHYQGAERLIDELVRYRKQFSFMSYPNRSHGIFEGEGTSEHFRTLMAEYFLENLPAGGR